jgi:hypothetical protein
VTHLRKMMLEELQRRNFSQHTTRSYIHTVEDFARRFHCRPTHFYGQLVSEPPGTLVHGKFRMHSFVRAFLTIWFGILIIIGGKIGIFSVEGLVTGRSTGDTYLEP